MVKKLIISLILILSVLIGLYSDIETKSFCVSFSMLSKDLILALLPFLIVTLMSDSILGMKDSSVKMLIFTLFLIFCSNFIATNFSFVVYNLFNSYIETTKSVNLSVTDLNVRQFFNIKQFVSPITAIVFSLAMNLLIKSFLPHKVDYIQYIAKRSSGILINYIILPLLPFLISGLIIKIISDGTLLEILSIYSNTFFIILLFAYGYITVWYIILFRGKKFFIAIKEMVMPVTIGMVTMSSSLAMPNIIKSLQKIIGKNGLIQATIPISINFHLIGDAFSIPILALSIIYSYTGVSYSYNEYFIMAIYLVIAKFAVVSIPGGSIFVLVGTLKSKFGFTEPMSSLIITIYLMFDFVSTSANVYANGAITTVICRISDKLGWNKQQSNKKIEEECCSKA
ncbi:dicarboxylate/amino acid:cation symporter [Anaplasmataceae bacterium AB001_6]|nr:dicarboxylate/amino acid:cation symporter [Anaplasmataceae bacterium AB001_6]